MKAIDVLVGGDGIEHGLPLNMRRQGKLHQNSVDLGVRVQPVNEGQQLGLAGLRGQMMVGHVQAGGVAGLLFIANVDRGGRILADQHHGQTRANAGLSFKRLHIPANAVPNVLRQTFPINELSRHIVLLNVEGNHLRVTLR